MPRLVVRRHRNWKGEPGYRWVCDDPEAIREHPSGGVIKGFSNECGWTIRLKANSRSPIPPALSRAMDGARKHLMRYHRED